MPKASIGLNTHVAREDLAGRSLLDRLRDETRPQHEELERRLDLLRPDLSIVAYSDLLGRFYGFYRPWEERIAPLASAVLVDYRERQGKTDRLVRDLAFLGIEAGALPLCTDLPAVEEVPALLGTLYVTEGATLGGQLISRHLRRTFHWPDGVGDSFFQSYGGRVGEMWRSFREVLLAHSAIETDDEIVHSAGKTFEALESWLCQLQ